MEKGRLTRRGYLAGVAASGVAALIYSQAPRFWSQFVEELNAPILPARRRPDPARWPDKGLFAAWLGHSAVLLKIDGFTVLTDPALGPRIGIAVGPFTLGFKRMIEPALPISRMPHIDLILLSHAHMDHMDLPSLRALERRATRVVTARYTSDLLRVNRYRSVQELGWGDRTRVGPLRLSAFEVKHWGARLRRDNYRGYNGYLLEADRYRVVFAGDTALTSSFRSLRSSRRIDLAIMPIGAYNPYIRNHCTPEQALTMGNQAGAEIVLPVHHQTFNLSQEPPDEPIERLLRAAGRDERTRIPVRHIGDEYRLAI